MGFFLPVLGVLVGVKVLGDLLGLDDETINNITSSGDAQPLKDALRDKYGITDTTFLEDEDGVSPQDIVTLQNEGVPNDVIELIKRVFGNKLNVNAKSVFKTNIVDIVKNAIEIVISTIDKLINIIEINKNNFEKLIGGVFDILRLFLNQLKDFSDLLPAGLLIGLVAPVFFLIAKFISIF